MNENKLRLLALTGKNFGKSEVFSLSKSQDYIITSFNKDSIDFSGLYKNKYDLILYYSDLFVDEEFDLFKKIRKIYTNTFPIIFIQKQKVELNENYFENTNTAFIYADDVSSEILNRYINLFYGNYAKNEKIKFEKKISDLYFDLSENNKKHNYNYIITSLLKSKIFNSAVLIVSNNKVFEIYQNVRIFDVENASEQISSIPFLSDIHTQNKYGQFFEKQFHNVTSLTKNGVRFFVENLYYSVLKINKIYVYFLLTSELKYEDDIWVRRIFSFLNNKINADFIENTANVIDNRLNIDELLKKTPLKFATFLVQMSKKLAQVVQCSSNFEQLTGIDNSNLKNIANWYKYFFKQHKYFFDIESPRCFINNATFEQEIRTKNEKSNTWLKLLSYRYINKDNQLFVFGVFIDVTDYKMIELELIAQKNQAVIRSQDKSSFLAKLSYDIRTVLNSILGFSSILSSAELNYSKRKKYGDIVKKSGQKMLKFLDNILTISLIDSKKITCNKETCKLNYLIKGIEIKYREILENDGKIDILTIIPDDTDGLFLNTDVKKLEKIFDILIENAIKYTIEGTISLGYYFDDEKKFVTFFVKDTGIGLTYEQKDNIFIRNTYDNDLNNKYSSGLSLHIAKGFVQFLNGEIWVESDLMEGSDFYFSLPFDTIFKNEGLLPQINLVPENQEQVVDFSKLKIVIAEDELMSAEYLKEIFLDTNANVKHVKNGQELMLLLEKYVPDLILLDLKMPIMNGIECLIEIKQKGIKSKIIVQTAFNYSSEEKKVLELNADGFISKPIDDQKLFDIINKLNFE
ncbi:MAG: response regulator [Bacteroidales bacterium]|nr:response regulator [Bacteroidales bacterium]